MTSDKKPDPEDLLAEARRSLEEANRRFAERIQFHRRLLADLEGQQAQIVRAIEDFAPSAANEDGRRAGERMTLPEVVHLHTAKGRDKTTSAIRLAILEVLGAHRGPMSRGALTRLVLEKMPSHDEDGVRGVLLRACKAGYATESGPPRAHLYAITAKGRALLGS